MPPPELAARVGVAAGTDPMQFYLDEGARLRRLVDELLPQGWRWDGKRVLDFGCGSARVLRQFATEAASADFMGCDIDAPSITWAERHLTPPFRFFHHELTPPLALRAESLDLILAMSVFTHISDRWAEWLAEMHRLLAPDGFLLASFLGEGMWEALAEDVYREDEVGMAVLRSWDGPYAWVFHSEWWLREHWGRGFDVVRVERPGRSPTGGAEITHSYLLVRKRDVRLTPDVLHRLDPREGRELAALQTSLQLARRDIDYLRDRRPEPVPHRSIRARLKKAKPALKNRLPQNLRWP
jgi:SAM-dependent methyltransferase